MVAKACVKKDVTVRSHTDLNPLPDSEMHCCVASVFCVWAHVSISELSAFVYVCVCVMIDGFILLRMFDDAFIEF